VTIRPVFVPEQVTFPFVDVAVSARVQGPPGGKLEIDPSSSRSLLTSIVPDCEYEPHVIVKLAFWIWVVRPSRSS
jgi:hypothetical protein